MLIRRWWRRDTSSRLLKTICILLTIWTCLEVAVIKKALSREATKPLQPFRNERVFITSIHWNDATVLRSHWAAAIFRLALDIGSDNVFVSIYESGSFDETQDVLQNLDENLERAGIRRHIVLDETTHQDEVEKAPAKSGWAQMPSEQSYRQNWTDSFTLEKGTWVPRRIPYLARLRNVVTQPLYELQRVGEVFDKILWLNDVVFDSDDVRRLLDTRGGEYAAACALDFKKPPKVYDTFALRDAEGYEPLAETWPYFRSRQSRDALKHGRPVPVASCWNGMVAFDAAPFYDTDRPLEFRGISDSLALSHLEGSECCLIHADNPLSRTKGVYINPMVRVGYDGTAYETVNPKASGAWPSSFAIAAGLWRNRMGRWLPGYRIEDRTLVGRLVAWETEDLARGEPGSFCLIDEMQILLWNGWGHA